MLTPLLPEKGVPIIIKQHPIVGDCYLLAGIDCIINSGVRGYEIIESLFTKVDSGVYVRIKRSVQSTNLNLAEVTAKYQFHYDPVTNEDVFFLDHKRLEEIDKTSIGVRTNALAISILEHLSSYYLYTSETHAIASSSNPKGTRRRRNSVEAHNEEYPFKPKWMTECTFTSKLLGVPVHHISSIEEIIRMKAIHPNLPVYVSMDYFDGRHSLRIKHVLPNQFCPGGYLFVVVNPWNNTLIEAYSLMEMLIRRASFSVFVVNSPNYTLLRFLLGSSEVVGKQIFADSALLWMVVKLRKIGGNVVTPQDIENFVVLYNRKTDVVVKFNGLPLLDQREIVSSLLSIKDAPHDKEKMRLLAQLESSLENRIQRLLSSGSDSEAPKQSYASVTKHGIFTNTTLDSSIRSYEGVRMGSAASAGHI